MVTPKMAAPCVARRGKRWGQRQLLRGVHAVDSKLHKRSHWWLQWLYRKADQRTGHRHVVADPLRSRIQPTDSISLIGLRSTHDRGNLRPSGHDRPPPPPCSLPKPLKECTTPYISVPRTSPNAAGVEMCKKLISRFTQRFKKNALIVFTHRRHSISFLTI